MQQIGTSCNSQCPASHLLWYISCSYDRRTYASWHYVVSSLASSLETSSNSINIKIASSTCRGSKLWNVPIIGRWSRDATSSRVMVRSPTGRWKLLVSLCHLFTKGDISPWSPVSTEHVIKGLNYVAATSLSIFGAGLPNFWTFFPWEDNFNSGYSCKKQINKS